MLSGCDVDGVGKARLEGVSRLDNVQLVGLTFESNGLNVGLTFQLRRAFGDVGHYREGIPVRELFGVVDQVADIDAYLCRSIEILQQKDAKSSD